MTTRFARLLTVNKLGYAHVGQLTNYLVSESGRESLILDDAEIKTLLDLVLSGKEGSFQDNDILVTIKFIVPDQVSIHWQGDGEPEVATFDEIRLVEIIDIAKVRKLILAREAARQTEKNKYL